MSNPIIFTLNKLDIENVLNSYSSKDAECEIVDEKDENPVVFLDPNKKELKMWFDETSGNIYPAKYDKPCFWCRSKFSSEPVGCPLEYEKDLFKCEGYFCNFPCVKAYILDERARTKDVKYDKSLTLLTFMFYKSFDSREIIPTASSWRALKKYGGHLEVDDFRNNFKIRETINVKQIRITDYLEERNN